MFNVAKVYKQEPLLYRQKAKVKMMQLLLITCSPVLYIITWQALLKGKLSSLIGCLSVRTFQHGNGPYSFYMYFVSL